MSLRQSGGRELETQAEGENSCEERSQGEAGGGGRGPERGLQAFGASRFPLWDALHPASPSWAD